MDDLTALLRTTRRRREHVTRLRSVVADETRRAILAASAAGMTFDQIAAETGASRTWVAETIAKHRAETS